MMKLLLIILVILPFSLFSMEVELKDCGKQEPIVITEKNLQKIVNTIDTAINEKYPQTIGSFFTKKTEDYHLNILAMPQTRYPSLVVTKSLIEKLISKNTKFSDAMTYFSDIENITCNTLQLMDGSPQPQSTPLISKISTEIRSYIIKSAQKNLNRSYDIMLKNNSDIKLCDICSQ